jgi:putative ABC transport system permease protein
VGILAPTGTPNDRALFINIEGFYLIPDHAEIPATGATSSDAKAKPADEHHDHAHDHDHAHHHDPLPEDQRAVSAILIRTKNDLFKPNLMKAVNDGNVAQAVYPIQEITKLFDEMIGPMRTILIILGALVVVVASIGVMVSIYNSMNDRRRELAIMRSLGAGRNTVLAIVLLEALLLSLGGGVLGVALGHGVVGILDPMIEAQTGVSIGPWEFPMYDWNGYSVPIELVLVPALIAAAVLSGLVPAIAAYRTDVAKTLAG